ncbi:tyrosine-type recombinase/integrase [Patescibacteria group bacterium]|nr:tyrosine-type recombinase/integrase [Patescibacteria group bacterium]
MEKLIKRFLKDLLEAQGTAINTVDAYRNDLRQFNEFSKTYPRKVEKQRLILDFISNLKEKGYANSTIDRRIAALASFFNYLIARGKIRVNPCDGIVRTRDFKFQPQVLTQKEIALFLATLQKSSTQEVKRDLAMMELLCTTGIRTTELVSLDIDMFKLDRGTPYIKIKKNGRQRDIAIAPRVVQTLKRYVVQIRPCFVKNTKEKALFVNRKGERLTRQGVWLKVKEHAKAAGLKDRVTPSVLRHSFAVHQLGQGVSLNRVQQLLGHSRVSTTKKHQSV